MTQRWSDDATSGRFHKTYNAGGSNFTISPYTHIIHTVYPWCVHPCGNVAFVHHARRQLKHRSASCPCPGLLHYLFMYPPRPEAARFSWHSLLCLLPLLPLAKGQFEESEGHSELDRTALTQEHVPYSQHTRPGEGPGGGVRDE